MDYPRDEIMRKAQETINRFPKSKVFFKFTCPYCRERCTFSDPNTLWEKGECCACGKESEIKEAGFALIFTP
jgi:hypothetical protein